MRLDRVRARRRGTGTRVKSRPSETSSSTPGARTLDKARILLVDDDETVRFGVRSFLENNGFHVDEASGCEQAEEILRRAPADIALLDYALPDGNAVELMPRLRETQSTLSFLVMTAHGSIDLAVQAVKQGAEQFVTKPIDLKTLQVFLEKTLESSRRRRKQVVSGVRAERRRLDPFVGSSEPIRRLKHQAEQIAESNSPVLIEGETGVGKGVLARWLHERGPRSDEPLVDLNCAGLSREFLETELFGHERGAFTGAARAKSGLLELAHRGTVFLDEIGDMDTAVQPRLLKVLEEKSFRRLGAVKPKQVDVRLIAAGQNVKNLVREGRFRKDLYFRISTLPLEIPALRHRREDIPQLAELLVESLGGPGTTITGDAYEALMTYHWPGNIRELRNVLERAWLVKNSGSIDRAALQFESDSCVSKDPVTLREVEQRHIEQVLKSTSGHVGRASEILSIPRSSLYEKIRKYGIDRETERAV